MKISIQKCISDEMFYSFAAFNDIKPTRVK